MGAQLVELNDIDDKDEHISGICYQASPHKESRRFLFFRSLGPS